MKDPVEFYPPSGNHLLVVLRVEKFGEETPFTLLDDVSVDLRHGPAIDNVVSKSCTISVPRFYSRCQLPNRLAYRPAELIQSPSVHPPVESPTHIGACQPELDKVGFVGHRVLVSVSLEQISGEEGKRTLIIVRRTLTVPKTAGAGVMLVASFMIFMASMAALSDERVTSRRFCRWDFAAMVETGGSCERKVRHAGCVGSNRDGRPFNTPHVNGLLMKSSIRGKYRPVTS